MVQRGLGPNRIAVRPCRPKCCSHPTPPMPCPLGAAAGLLCKPQPAAPGPSLPRCSHPQPQRQWARLWHIRGCLSPLEDNACSLAPDHVPSKLKDIMLSHPSAVLVSAPLPLSGRACSEGEVQEACRGLGSCLGKAGWSSCERGKEGWQEEVVRGGIPGREKCLRIDEEVGTPQRVWSPGWAFTLGE